MDDYPALILPLSRCIIGLCGIDNNSLQIRVPRNIKIKSITKVSQLKEVITPNIISCQFNKTIIHQNRRSSQICLLCLTITLLHFTTDSSIRLFGSHNNCTVKTLFTNINLYSGVPNNLKLLFCTTESKSNISQLKIVITIDIVCLKSNFLTIHINLRSSRISSCLFSRLYSSTIRISLNSTRRRKNRTIFIIGSICQLNRIIIRLIIYNSLYKMNTTILTITSMSVIHHKFPDKATDPMTIRILLTSIRENIKISCIYSTQITKTTKLTRYQFSKCTIIIIAVPTMLTIIKFNIIRSRLHTCLRRSTNSNNYAIIANFISIVILPFFHLRINYI